MRHWLIGGTLLLAATGPVRAETPPAPEPPAFETCLKDLAALAVQRGVAPGLVAARIEGLSPDPEVLAASRNQAEFEKPVWASVDSATKPSRVETGRAKLAQWAPDLAAIETEYGVDRHVLVAIWGIESGYGSVLDDPARVRPVLRSLATLACGGDGRAGLWRDEWVAALQLLERGDVTAERMTGSWAGAMGHTQFMPTTVLRHAVDRDGDGRRDIWGSVPDALASAANFLVGLGWRRGEGWGGEVLLPDGFDYRLADETTERSVAAWRDLGVRPVDAAAFADPGATARLLVPTGAAGPAFLLRPNFSVILRYNAALPYGLAVALLSDRLRGGPDLARPWPRGDRMLTGDERRELQATLAARGFPVGTVDGRIGPRTRAAIRSYQAGAGLVPDGYAEARLLDRLRAGRPNGTLP
ncbi:lytic murein transglycosylase [uncultured Methylobacterium sp.]|jgi:membrane-bound lytic murein transglycosylase B|uniref:lytic murein transglycosylase n=1 Tax=uncultured Methylobacterium sp. TaxID=157278 RepID=UPI002603A5CB|nr:lytic murein transglycosylase [uncultured Methylobacterium sp.]